MVIAFLSQSLVAGTPQNRVSHSTHIMHTYLFFQHRVERLQLLFEELDHIWWDICAGRGQGIPRRKEERKRRRVRTEEIEVCGRRKAEEACRTGLIFLRRCFCAYEDSVTPLPTFRGEILDSAPVIMWGWGGGGGGGGSLGSCKLNANFKH